MYSSSISDCTAHNVAYCDVGNGTPQDGFSLRFLPLKSGGGVAGWRPTLHMNLKAQLLQKRRSPHPARGGLLPLVAIRTDYTPISFKDLQRKTIKVFL